MKITTDAVQILGGYGCLKSGNLERTMRDAKITQIYEGTNQVQRFVVAEQLITEFLEKYGMGREGTDPNFYKPRPAWPPALRRIVKLKVIQRREMTLGCPS